MKVMPVKPQQHFKTTAAMEYCGDKGQRGCATFWTPAVQKKPEGEKRSQPCGQKLIFLLVAHCWRRANMPRENSTTHTPLFSSALHTAAELRANRAFCVSPEDIWRRPVQPEALSHTFVCSWICHFQTRAPLFTFQFRSEHLSCLVLFLHLPSTTSSTS